MEKRMPSLKAFLKVIDRIVNWSSQIISFLIYPCVIIIVVEVIRRYAFNDPSIWGHELSTFFFGIVCVVGGGYATLKRGHVVVDIFINRLNPRKRAIMDIITMLFFFFFAYVLLTRGWESFLWSVRIGEHTQTAWGPPFYPIKFFIPFGAVMFLLGGLSKLIEDILIVLGKENPEVLLGEKGDSSHA